MYTCQCTYTNTHIKDTYRMERPMLGQPRLIQTHTYTHTHVQYIYRVERPMLGQPRLIQTHTYTHTHTYNTHTGWNDLCLDNRGSFERGGVCGDTVLKPWVMSKGDGGCTDVRTSMCMCMSLCLYVDVCVGVFDVCGV